jgi:hypothetical protein
MAEENEDTGTGGRDRLSMAKLSNMYGFASEVINSDPELRRLFTWASEQGPDLPGEAFLARLYKTRWWSKSSEPFRAAYKLEYAPDETWEQVTLPRATTAVKLAADNIGVTLEEGQARKIARKSIYGGWTEDELTSYLVSGGEKFKGLAGQRGDLYGAALETYESIRDAAENSGLSFNEKWYRTQATRVLDPLDETSNTDVYQLIAKQAQSLYPALADQIGIFGDRFVTAREAASSYISTLAQAFELDENEIDLRDPLLAKALKNVDDKGKPALMPLWQLQREAVADSRWQNTSAATAAYQSMSSLIAETFGVGF